MLDIRDRNGNTALHLSCKRGNKSCVEALTTPLTHQEVQAVSYSVPFQKVPQDQAIQNYEGEDKFWELLSLYTYTFFFYR